MITAEMGERVSSPVFVREQLAEFAQTADPVDQWHILDTAALHDPSEACVFVQSMLAIAEDPASSQSLSVRMHALELAAYNLKHAQPTADVEVFYELQQRFQTVLPEYFDIDTPRPVPRQCNDSELLSRFGWYARDIALQERFPTRLLIGEERSFYTDTPTHTYIEWVIDYPGVGIVPGLAIERIMDDRQLLTRNALTSMTATMGIGATHALLENLPGMVRGEKSWDSLQAVAQKIRLAKYNSVTGMSFHSPIDKLAHAREPESTDYTQVFNDLYKSAAAVGVAFPEELAGGVGRGARMVVVRGIAAVLHHLENNKHTDEQFPLTNGHELPAQFEGDEPLMLLRGLDWVFQELGETFSSPHLRSVLSITDKGFKMYRLFREPGYSSVTHHNRPLGDRAYDPRYEYGRPNEGVEATIGNTVDLRRRQGLPALMKQQKGLGAISIRLDREARPDPTAEQGKISLDIGSVLGDSRSFGTKLGRLLAWGDHLMNTAYNDTTLNHISYTLPQRYGNAAEFMRLALSMDARMQAVQMNEHELRAYHAGSSL